MFKYKVTYITGVKEFIRANSPKHASELAVKAAIVHIKWVS